MTVESSARKTGKDPATPRSPLYRYWRTAVVFLFGLVAALRTDAACVSAPAAIVGWWPGDGTASDLAGTNDGVLQGGATATATGLVGSAFSFDGTNGYVQIPDGPALRPTNLTVEAWVQFSSLDSAGTAPAGQQYIVFKQNSRAGSFEGYNLAKIRTAGGDALAFIVSSVGGQLAQLQSATLVTTGLWYHVAGVRGSNFTQLYVNGQLERQTNVYFPQDYGNFPLLFGSSGQSYWDRKLKGSLDEVSLYDRALSSNEVAAIYAAGAAGKCKSFSIVAQPQSQTVIAGNNAVFTVGVVSPAPRSYQWQFNGANLPGATGANLTLTSVQPPNAGDYSVVATSSAASLTSAVAVLTVVVPPVITVQPQSRTNVTGTIATFSATATGNTVLTYQWRLNGLSLADGARISGATTNVLTVASVQATDSGSYTLVVGNAAGAVTSAVAILTISGPPSITSQPASQSVAAGNSVRFSVSAVGTPPLGYQWRKNGADLSDSGTVSGATGPSLTMVNVQTNDMGGYQVAITNGLGSITSTVASLIVTPPFQAGSQSAGAVVLVNSQSARFLDFKHFIQPYLDNFGFPYTVLDITTNAPSPSLSNCAVIIIGHSQLDTNRVFLNATAQSNISLAVANGTGLVNFDNDLSSMSGPRYQFVQDLFGFSYGSSVSASTVSLPPTEPSSQMHYITARHPTNDTINFRSTITLPGLNVSSNATALALIGGQPLVVVAKYGQGRVVQWGSYDWMLSTVLGPIDGLDDSVWRGVVWAARKPFVMRGLPSFVTMRVDDVTGPFDWVHAANAVGFKPFLALFFRNITEAYASDLQALTTSGSATASIHSFDANPDFFYFNHATLQPWPDNVQSNNFYLGTQWHLNHGIPISKVVVSHYNEIGPNCFAGLKAWGVEFFLSQVVPGNIEFATPGAPWLIGGPYRLYETPQPAQVYWPTYYADWIAIPAHPEFDGQFFNYCCEIRDASNCGEWCPDNDVAGSIARGTRTLKRALDSMVMACAFTHEWYITPASWNTPISATNWQAILQGITNNLAAYNPIYVTLDYASQYVRATRTSRLQTAVFDPASGQVSASFSGKADLDTQVYVFVGGDNAITCNLGPVPAFMAPITNIVATLGARPEPPVVLNPPAVLTTNTGAIVIFTVAATGTAPLNYQWFQNSTPLSNGGDIFGASGPTLTLSGVAATNGGTYTVVVTNLAGSATGTIATLTVVRSPRFTSINLLPGKIPVFAVSGESNSSYRIEISADLTTWTTLTNIPAPNGSAQFVDPAGASLSRRFYRTVWIP